MVTTFFLHPEPHAFGDIDEAQSLEVLSGLNSGPGHH
jgi:hypothetical protein